MEDFINLFLIAILLLQNSNLELLTWCFVFQLKSFVIIPSIRLKHKQDLGPDWDETCWTFISAEFSNDRRGIRWSIVYFQFVSSANIFSVKADKIHLNKFFGLNFDEPRNIWTNRIILRKARGCDHTIRAIECNCSNCN